ncbi:MAG: hypothetical protein CUN55_14640, partial [Phototrophicales bacterium]
IQPFIEALNDPDAHIRARAAEILGKLRSEAAIDALVAAMFDDKNRYKFDRGLFFQKNVQDVAVEALLDIGTKTVARVFADLLNHEERAWRTRAVGLLRQLSMRQPELRSEIVHILQLQLQNPELEMRTLAIEALRAIIIEDGISEN